MLLESETLGKQKDRLPCILALSGLPHVKGLTIHERHFLRVLLQAVEER